MKFSENKYDVGCFDNTYARLPEGFYERVRPTAVKAPALVFLNDPLVAALQLNLKHLSRDEIASIFAGNALAVGMEPIAQAYSGHQFGHFAGQLGDGRAILLGEVLDREDRRWDVQLKGSGRTRFSRSGDGRAALGAVLREYILSEAMHHLNIPTTRSLAVVTTGEAVFRDGALPGAVLTRIASSHIRVGTFQYFAASHNHDALKQLADYVIQRHYPEARDDSHPYLALLKGVVERQASLVAKWMHVGFIHGVMNTDNTALSGETIDYGPCAFMDAYDPDTVFSSIDHAGRYAYGNQGNIAVWNVTRFAECLLDLFDQDQERSVELANEGLATFQPAFERFYLEGMFRKIGIIQNKPEDISLIEDLLTLMKNYHVDYTLSFRYLCDGLDEGEGAVKLKALFANSSEFNTWHHRWRKRLKEEESTIVEISLAMRSVNPAFIPRNHRVEEALQAAVVQNNFSKTEQLIEVLAKPFDDQPDNAAYMNPPKPEERVRQTFCGT